MRFVDRNPKVIFLISGSRFGNPRRCLWSDRPPLASPYLLLDRRRVFDDGLPGGRHTLDPREDLSLWYEGDDTFNQLRYVEHLSLR
jgi:hypothetical protein